MPNAILVGLVSAVSAFAAFETRADDLRVPSGMMLCRSAEAVAAPDHPGCWRAVGGQVIDHINPVETWSQIIVRSSNGAETMAVYARKSDADQILRPSPPVAAGNADQAKAAQD